MDTHVIARRLRDKEALGEPMTIENVVVARALVIDTTNTIIYLGMHFTL